MALTSDDIRREALRLGFSKAGISRVEPIPEAREHLAEWLDRGYQSGMNWMQRNASKRGDPELVLPGVRSIISVAINYFTGEPRRPDEPAGKISRYAWGDDYHDILTEKLEELLAFIRRREPDARGLVYVDTGPVLEKFWAQRAGLGWIGKHTTLISPDFGSWVFLGEILCTLELAPDAPETDQCGSCTLCIEACPTNAIVAPYVLDAGRCISYLTIEHRGDFPGDLPGNFEGWLYGCDICQDVCPWNIRLSAVSDVPGFSARPGNEHLDPASVEVMSLEEFNARFAGSPVTRTKLTGLKRNAQALVRNTKSSTQNRIDDHGQSL
jgi:epoxyqueuosine reductase